MNEYSAYFLDPEEVAPGSSVVRHADGWRLFQNPSRVEVAYRADEVLPLLRNVDQANQRGEWVVGFLAYEAASAMDQAIRVHSGETPLAWFAFYETAPHLFRALAPFYEDVTLDRSDSDWSKEEYLSKFWDVKRSLSEGSAYQVNLTYRNRYRSPQGGFDLFRSWCGIEAPPYSCFICTEKWDVACLSPELFIERARTHVTMRPMKGTALRGRTRLEEASAREWLKGAKTLAENLMIVDMVRNDLGRIAEIGSVSAPSLMDIEIHRDLLQVTSTVSAKAHGANTELIQSIFPPASVTGAPKVASCNLIHDLESSPRGVYCGTVGLWSPDRLDLAVSIRTAFILKSEPSEVTYGVGGGIVWDSDGEDEYRESNLKLGPIQNPAEQWQLTEAFHASSTHGQRERHLVRLSLTAKNLGIPFDIAQCRRAIETAIESGEGEKIRIALNRSGEMRVTRGASLLAASTLKACLASSPSNSSDPNYQIKTNAKAHYRRERSKFRYFDEVLFYNERDEVTEFSAGNIVLRFGSELVTPNRDAGLLFGLTVQDLVGQGKVLERALAVTDLETAEQVFVANAVVGMKAIELLL